jgi:hypothetical protein
MRRISHNLVTGLLLFLYGGISVLGYGLHELVPEDGHHHHALAAVQQEGAPLAFKSGGGIDDDHDCDICAFLDQARSAQPQIQSAIVWQHLVAVVEQVTPRIASQTFEHSHVPRGPPVLFG